MRRAGSQRQKEAFAEIAAAAPGYAERARVAAAPRAARHLALHPRRPPAAREATVWVSAPSVQAHAARGSPWLCCVLLQSGDSALSAAAAAAAPHAASPARRVRGRPRRGRPGGPGRVGPGGEGGRGRCPPIATRTPQVQRSAGAATGSLAAPGAAHSRLSAVSSPPPEAGPGAMR